MCIRDRKKPAPASKCICKDHPRAYKAPSRPRGRPKKGRVWDYDRGQYVAQNGAEAEEPASLLSVLAQQAVGPVPGEVQEVKRIRIAAAEGRDIDPVLIEVANLLDESGRSMRQIAKGLFLIADRMEQGLEIGSEHWTQEELVQLKALVTRYGTSNLLRIANAYAGHSRSSTVDKLKELLADGHI
eukprot:TRINITY_DN37051_c0_g1_i2.p1 TRINITY_DN37051_c0_g1~~TRINITY_DN37051_c0_g1_i2.p1  ORF type:complete len:185 (-),score=42.45 TRINITY_DN37051_c0_g1_i2:218-772(-)